MKTRFMAAGLLFLGVVLWSCSSEQTAKADKTDAAAPSAADQMPAKPEVFLYVSLYKGLRLRDQPNEQSNVVVKVNNGDVFVGTGVWSEKEVTVELRGIPMQDKFAQVRTLQGKEGWVFGAAVQQVYAGASAGSPDPEKIQEISTHLFGLNAKAINSGKQAWDYVRRLPEINQPVYADAILVLLENFLRRMELEGQFYSMTETVNWTDKDYEAIASGKFDMKTYPITRQLAASGFTLAYAEGSVFPVYDWNLLRDFFAPKVSPGMKAFIEQSVLEQNMTAMDDGGILIPLEELADRAVFWEKFTEAQPYFPYKAQAEESQRWLTNTLMLGSDNTPVFNYETQEVLPEYRAVWDYVQKKYPETQVASRVKAFQSLCAAEGWKRTGKVEEAMGTMVQ